MVVWRTEYSVKTNQTEQIGERQKARTLQNFGGETALEDNGQ